MRRKKFLTLAAALLCGVVSAIAFTSCDDDDDPKTTSLRLNPAKVEVTVGATANVSVSGGAEPYTVKSADEAVATVKANKSSITVTGVKAGTTTVLVSDKNKQTGSLSVTVKEKGASLDFDKNSVNIAVGKEVTVTVKSGKAPYTATSKDTKVATVSVKDGKITIKGVKAGTTEVTVGDKDKLSGTIKVSVK